MPSELCYRSVVADSFVSDSDAIEVKNLSHYFVSKEFKRQGIL